MGEVTGIKWTDHTFNPWMGCTKVSPGCDNCYAEALGKRTGRVQWGDDAERVVTSDGYWNNPRKWNRMAEVDGQRHLVFCASLADVFEDRADLIGPRARLWEVIEDTPHLTWQLLTKRPENVGDFAPIEWLGDGTGAIPARWPRNVWLGTTVEDQDRANERVPALLRYTQPPVRFLSCEPLLGPVDLTPWLTVGFNAPEWVIVGGESGPHHRPLDLGHARSLRDQCAAALVPLFFKQVGGRTPMEGGDLLDGRRHHEFPDVAPSAMSRHHEHCGPDASLSGVDQTDLLDPEKVWRCDSCGAEGTSDELQGRASTGRGA